MSIQQWSDHILLVELADDPHFTSELDSLMAVLARRSDVDVVLNMSEVTFVNSSNLARLLKLRKVMITKDRQLRLCGLRTELWSAFLVTGLDAIFEFADDVATALASLQMSGENR